MTLSNRGAILAFNHLLDQAPWARERLMPFAGAVVCIEAPPLSLSFSLDHQGFALEPDEASASPEATISFALADLPALIPQGLQAVARSARVAGNAELAEALAFVGRNLRWDIEEDLSRLFGDIAAHRMTGLAQSLQTAQRQGLVSLAGNISEYLVEEQPLLVSTRALKSFVDEVSALRDGVARLEKRLQRLRAHRTAPASPAHKPAPDG